MAACLTDTNIGRRHTLQRVSATNVSASNKYVGIKQMCRHQTNVSVSNICVGIKHMCFKFVESTNKASTARVPTLIICNVLLSHDSHHQHVSADTRRFMSVNQVSHRQHVSPSRGFRCQHVSPSRGFRCHIVNMCPSPGGFRCHIVNMCHPPGGSDVTSSTCVTLQVVQMSHRQHVSPSRGFRCHIVNMCHSTGSSDVSS